MQTKFKTIAIGFGFFFLSYVVARIIDAKFGITQKIAQALPASFTTPTTTTTTP